MLVCMWLADKRYMYGVRTEPLHFEFGAEKFVSVG